MHMGIVSKLLGHESGSKRTGSLGDASYLDLGEMEGSDAPEAGASVWVRVCELSKLEDLKEFAHHVYDGHILVIDIKKIATDEILLRRFTNDLKKIAADVRGDMAGLAENLVVLTPGGVRVDKHKLKASPSK